MSGRDALLEMLDGFRDRPDIATAMRTASSYAGASGYLLVRDETASAGILQQVVTSDWPFDLVGQLGASLLRDQARHSEVDRCLTVLRPVAFECPAAISLPQRTSRTCWLVGFFAANVRMFAAFLYREGLEAPADRLQEAALIIAYAFGEAVAEKIRPERVLDLTDRELECLAWIAEGKTSDEISTIIGISRNTVNNYITSIMRKTATRSRSEAIAIAVRNSLI